MIDVRHEQAAAFMCQAYSRLKQVPSVCMAASGPGVTNLITGMANALIDCCPVVSLGGSSPISQFGRQVFQEIDQVELMRGCSKHVDRLLNLKRIPQQINFALQKAITGKPGPVYVDCPGDMLYQKIDENLVDWSFAGRPIMDSRPLGDPRQVDALVEALSEAKQPLIVSGSGVIWSRAWNEMQAFVESRRHPVLHHAARPRRGARRSSVFLSGDALVGVPRCRPDHRARHADELHHRPRLAAALRAGREDRAHRHRPRGNRRGRALRRYPDRRRLQGGAGAVAGRHQGQGQRRQLTRRGGRSWRKARRRSAPAPAPTSTPRTATSIRCACWRKCANFAKRDAILCVDGQETLNYGRQTMPTFTPGHRLNSGPFGTMGVGLPFGVGAKVACPDKQVIVVHGDGSMGMNAMEMDTAMRHKIPILIVISLNGGWTGDPKREKPGRDLGYMRYDKMCEALGGYGEYITQAGGYPSGAGTRAEEGR